MDGELWLEDDLFLDPGGWEITNLPELRTGIIGRSTNFSLPKFGGFTTLKQACNPKGAISNSNIIIFQPFFWLLDVFVFDVFLESIPTIWMFTPYNKNQHRYTIKNICYL